MGAADSNQWEGVVTQCADGAFSAILYDLTDKARPKETARFQMDAVPESDRDLVAPGAVFVWVIEHGASRLAFWRKVWTVGDLEDVEAVACEYERLLGGDAG